MSILLVLETLLIGPLKLIFEIVFVIANRVLGGRSGLAIIALSLLVNILLLPLYKRADAIQEQSRDKEESLREGVAHIKKTFSGDERMMILQTYYRQNNYKPTDVLNGSVSLLLEVPFFMAAYQFLSHLTVLNGASFGPIADLGAPDGLLVIGGLTINLLPVLMTLINVISSAVYLRGFPLKTKLQLYGMAAFFLVFLYNSPSGLVFYWTLNNAFSLVKNLYGKSKRIRKAGKQLCFVAGVAVMAFGILGYHPLSMKRKLFVIGIGAILMVPMLWGYIKNRIPASGAQEKPVHPNQKLFVSGSVFLTFLTGLLIPSTYIAASPLEYVDPTYYHDPLLYVLITFCMAAGTFLIWMRVFYWLSSTKGKFLFDRIVWVLSGVMLVNYMFFGRNLGVVDATLQYVDGMDFTTLEELTNLAVLAAIAVVMLLAIRRWEKQAVSVLLVASIAIGAMSALNMVTIRTDTEKISDMVQTQQDAVPTFPLSKNGKNVVVIMLDRALGYVTPYIFQEKPELETKFDGFVYYPNTISHGGYTIFGAPALYGGYEYTPVEMNKRDSELLVDKHNEALKVMPVLFSENGYRATMLNPVLANHQWIPDTSVFDEYPQIKAVNTNGIFIADTFKQQIIDANYRNFFCFSLVKSMPVILQKSLYYGGNYNQALAMEVTSQTTYDLSRAEHFNMPFMEEYAVMSNLPTMTEVTEDVQNTFMAFSSDITHELMLLQAPEYVPAQQVDNGDYDAAHSDRFTKDSRVLNVQDVTQMGHYHANMAAMLKLAEWFDYLRENGVYDNTRIILVSDHGRALNMRDELLLDTGMGETCDVSAYYPLLMVKDFDSHGFTSSDEFMTNADVITFAVQDLLADPVNPFTGNPITNSEKYAHEQYVLRSDIFDTKKQTGTTYISDTWASVKDDVMNADNWSFSGTKAVLKEHAMP